jgi:hypothetical protein
MIGTFPSERGRQTTCENLGRNHFPFHFPNRAVGPRRHFLFILVVTIALAWGIAELAVFQAAVALTVVACLGNEAFVI